jgi:ATP-binding cassette, subfamily B, multidrug efflux pump
VSEGLTTSVSQTVQNCTVMVGVLIIMFKYSWKLTLIVLASNFPLILFTRLSWHCTALQNNHLQKAKAEMCSYAEETLSNIRTVKAFSDEKQCVARYNQESQKVFYWGNRNAQIWGFFMAQIQILGAGSLAIVCFAASVFKKNGEIDLGTITAFLLYMRNF